MTRDEAMTALRDAGFTYFNLTCHETVTSYDPIPVGWWEITAGHGWDHYAATTPTLDEAVAKVLATRTRSTR